jgi:hypothetical protein
MSDMLRRRLVGGLAAAALVSVGIARAQPGPGGPGAGPGMMGGGPGGGGMMGGAGGGMMGGRGGGMMGGGMTAGGWDTDRYLDSLKHRLGITPAQEPAWKDYADTVSGIGQQMQGMHQTMFEAMGTADWDERRTMMNTMFQARQQAFGTVHEAAQKLLPTLSPKQQGQAQEILPGLAVGRGMMGGRGRGYRRP